jgi:pyrimidine-nucleoside phosphorylase
LEAFRAVELIARKRDGGALGRAELAFLVEGYLHGGVAEGQMAAFLMAGVLRGFTHDEALALADILVDSGERLDLSRLPGPTVDKHSTGGVGDGTTLLVGPLLASAGAQLVKLSGRGLGHTGGTLDKLEAIPGFRTELDPDELLRIVGEVGCAVAAQSERLVPADRVLYALRDVTATVASPALIASSVMSKKLAAGAATIVLDVKAGDGAFMPTAEAARELAALCVEIGTGAGRRCVALVTAMEQPLGRGIGNGLEVAEAVQLLGAAPEASRLGALALELATEGLATATGEALDAARARLRDLWNSGRARERLARMVEAQGGDPRVCEDPAGVLPAAPVVRQVTAGGSGHVARLPARAVGEIAGRLGAGRQRKEDPVDPAVGLELAVEVGDTVDAGTVVATVHARSEQDADWAGDRLRDILVLSGEPVPRPPTILDRVGGAS